MEYKELIEKEARKMAYDGLSQDNAIDRLYSNTLCSGFIAGINSELNARIIEIEKRKYLEEYLNKKSAEFTKLEYYDASSNLIDDNIDLLKEIANLEKEIKR